MEILNLSPEQLTQGIQVLLAAHALASAIVALTPTPKDDQLLAKAYKLIEALALTVGRAKEKG